MDADARVCIMQGAEAASTLAAAQLLTCMPFLIGRSMSTSGAVKLR
jgi:hypothetical protein